MKAKPSLMHIITHLDDAQRGMLHMVPFAQHGGGDIDRMDLRIYTGPGGFIWTAEFKSIRL